MSKKDDFYDHRDERPSIKSALFWIAVPFIAWGIYALCDTYLSLS